MIEVLIFFRISCKCKHTVYRLLCLATLTQSDFEIHPSCCVFSVVPSVFLGGGGGGWCWIVYHNLFIHSLVGRHFGFFSNLGCIEQCCWWTFVNKSLCGNALSFLLEWDCWVICLTLKIKKLPNLSQRLEMYEGYSCSRFSSKPDIVSLFFFFFFLIIYLVSLDLSCGKWDLASYLTRDWTRAPCIGSSESWTLDHQ